MVSRIMVVCVCGEGKAIDEISFRGTKAYMDGW